MKMKARVMSLLVAATVGCNSHGSVSENDRRAATAEISVVLDSMNAAWRRADFVAANQPLLDEGLTTFNGAVRDPTPQRPPSRRIRPLA